MGAVAAIVGASAAVIGAGVSAYSASQQGGAALSAPKKVGDTTSLKLPDTTSTFAPYLDQQQYLPALSSFNKLLSTTDNKQFQDQLSATDPSLMGNIATVGRNASSYLSGAIPADVSAEVQRSSSYKALTGGYAGSTMGANLTARDLGLTSLGLQSKGADMTNAELSLAKGVTPYNYTTDSLLSSPQQLLQRQDDQTYYNTDLSNQKSFMDAGHAYASNLAQQQQQSNASAAMNQSLVSGIKTLGTAAPTLYKSLSGLFGGSNTNAAASANVTGMPDQSQQTVTSTNVDNLSAINLASLTGTSDPSANSTAQDYITTGTDFSSLG